MKELLYIPSGKFFRFLDTSEAIITNNPTVSLEQFAKSKEGLHPNNGRGDIEFIIQKIIDHQYIIVLYTAAEVPDFGQLYRSEFEIVEVY